MTTKKLWQPDIKSIKSSNLWSFIQSANTTYSLSLSDYQDLYQWSIRRRDQFWTLIAQNINIRWHKKSTKTLIEPSSDLMTHQWFKASQLNYAERLLNHHTPEHKIAIVYIDQNGQRETITYDQLRQQVNQVVSGLKKEGIQKGDRVAAVMPNQIETVIFYLATTAVGAIWTACSPDFGISAIVERLRQVKPKLLLSTTGYCYNQKVINLQEKIKNLQAALTSLKLTVLVESPLFNYSYSNVSTYCYQAWLAQQSTDKNNFTSVDFNHPLCILYSSGTTGKPKCITHSHGGTLLQHYKELVLHTNLKSNNTLFYYTTCGWMMWNWLVSALMTGATIVLYDGCPFYTPKDQPDIHPADILWTMALKERINVFGVSASYLNTLAKSGYRPADHGKFDALTTVLSTGSPLTEESFDFVYTHIKSNVQLSSISGGTDIISCFALGNPMTPVYKGQIQAVGLAMDVDFFNAQGESVDTGQKGELVCKQSFPSMPVKFWNDHDNQCYKNSYFHRYPNIWAHGDFGCKTQEHGIIIHGRSDTTLNPAGVRIGTAEIYNEVLKISTITDCMAVSKKTNNDEEIFLFIRLAKPAQLTPRLAQTIRTLLRNNASPRHVPKGIYSVETLPNTINGKGAERVLSAILNHEPVENTETLADKRCLNAIKHITNTQQPL